MKARRDSRIVGNLTTADLRRAIEREGLAIPKGSSLGLFITVDGRNGGVEKIHVGYGVNFEIIIDGQNEQG